MWSIIIVCQKEMEIGAETVKKIKSKFDLWHFDFKSTEVLLRSRSTYMWSIIIVCQIEEELWYRNHLFTDGQTDGQADSHGETSIPTPLRCRGYTNLFSMWRNRWKMTPLEVKISWGSHFFKTSGSIFNVKIWPVSAFNVEKWPGESFLTLKNYPGSHFSTGSVFNVTPVHFFRNTIWWRQMWNLN